MTKAHIGTLSKKATSLETAEVILVCDSCGRILTSKVRSELPGLECADALRGRYLADVIAGSLDHAARDVAEYLISRAERCVVDRRIIPKGDPPIRFYLQPIFDQTKTLCYILATATPMPTSTPSNAESIPAKEPQIGKVKTGKSVV